VPLNGVRSSIRNVETNLGDLVADAMLYAGQVQAAQYASDYDPPRVSLQNGGGIRNDSVLPAGELTLGDLNSVLPFTNYVSIVPDVSPAQLKEIAEHAIATAGETGGQFGQIAGMRIVYDIRGTAQVTETNGASVTTPGTRIVSLVLNDGTVIVDEGEVQPGAPNVTIATINFLAAGGDNYPFHGTTQIDTPMLYQDALRIYVQDALDGEITTARYPEGGDGRNVRLQNKLLDGQSWDASWSWSPVLGYYYVGFYPYVWTVATGDYLYVSEFSVDGEVWAYSYADDCWLFLGADYLPWVWYSDGRGANDGWVVADWLPIAE
jgi:5'-nucleotidase